METLKVLPHGFYLLDGILSRRCSKCKSVKPVAKFGEHLRSDSGRRSRCKMCRNQDRHLDPNKQLYLRRWNLRRHGMTIADYDEMFEKQNGVCAICGLPEITQRLSVDHGHETDKVRGLLCQTCNRGLGLLGDNVQTLLKVVDYLKNEK